MSTLPKSDKNQAVGEQPDYIVLTIDYQVKLILPIRKGLEFIETWATGLEVYEPHNKPVELRRVKKNFNIEFLSQQALNEMRMLQVLETSSNDDS